MSMSMSMALGHLSFGICKKAKLGVPLEQRIDAWEDRPKINLDITLQSSKHSAAYSEVMAKSLL